MPRPDLAELGISYRRIPVLAIGRHVYCDSRMILQVLQERYPLPETTMNGSDKAIQRLLQDWTNDQIFSHATNCLPFERSAVGSNPAFLKDRSEAFSRPFRIEDMIKKRPESYNYIRAMFQTLESFLEDGRDWIVGSGRPSLVDIDAVYIAQWIVVNPMMEGVTPKDFISEKLFPRTYAWVYRFKRSVGDAEAQAPTPTALSGSEAFDKITSTPKTGLTGDISDTDPLNLKIGQMVEVWPTDWASNHKDRGELVMLAVSEVCIRNVQGILVHFPRWNFRIQKVEEGLTPTSAAVADTLAPLDRPHRLFYHPLSPFSRKVYMFALELGTADRIELQTVVVAPVKYSGWSDDVPTVAESNPLAKIPTLVVGNNGDGVYDSKVICDFLEDEALVNKRSDLQQRNRRLRTLHSCADGMMDAQVLILYEKKIRAENHISFQAWIDGQTEKIMRGFDRLELEVGRGTLQAPANDTPASAAECAVATCVAFMDKVGIQWRNERPRLVEWFQGWQGRESFVKTRPNVDWKTGEVAEIVFGREVLSGNKG
jgi:glutathione S-transferase